MALAERFVADEGNISTVIIASGESMVDAVTAAGLAGNLNAAVMLTRSNQLPHNVARFIDEHNITDVLVVGGTAAVPDAIVTAIEGLGSRPDVSRISGADRYATAARIGDELGGPNPTWCGSTQTAVILVNGGDDGRADAIVAGPLAFRLGLPVLLTDADEIPDSTSSFLTDNKVERVVIVGGVGAVSAGVVNTLVEDVGVVNVQRISGGSAAGTSVAVAKEMLGNCAEVLGTNRDMVALVNRDAVADGITSAPVLGRGLGDGGSIPILLVGDELPAAVSDYLASTAEVRGGQKTHQTILAIGGTAVVSDSVVADAVAAAKTSAALTAEIKVAKNATGTAYESWSCDADDDTTTDDVVCGGVFTVTFSDDVKLPVDGADSDTIAGNTVAELVDTALDPTLYRLNGRRIEALHTVDPRLAPTPAGTDEELIGYSDLVFTADRTVKIYLSHILEPDDKIEVVGGGKIGANGDQRKLESSELTLGALASSADRTAPVVEIIAYEGASTFVVYVTEPNILHNELVETEWDEFISVDGKGTTEVAIDAPVDSTDDTTDPNERQGVDKRLTVTLAASDTLEVGDTIIVERQAILDESGRGNSQRRRTVEAHKAQGKFEVSSVSIGDYVHTAQATAELVAVAPDAGDKLIIGAKKGGIADGAAGNDWVIYGYDDRPDTDAATDGVQNANVFNIRTAVDTANKVISYTISQTAPPTPLPAGTGPTLGDLAVALVSNDTFAANFTVSYDTPANQSKDSALGGTDPAGEHFGDEADDDSETAGMTAVGVEVKFNDIVQNLTATTDGATSDDGVALAASIAPENGGATGTVSFLAPDNVVHISYASANLAALPKRAGFRVIPAGIATSYNTDGNGDGTADGPARNIREILNSLRPDSSIKP